MPSFFLKTSAGISGHIDRLLRTGLAQARFALYRLNFQFELIVFVSCLCHAINSLAGLFLCSAHCIIVFIYSFAFRS